MCGDSLHTDILGAAAQGWKTVLVTKDGLFSGFEVTLHTISKLGFLKFNKLLEI